MNGPGFKRALVVAALMLMIPAAAFCGPPEVDLKRLATEFDHWQTMASGDDFVYLDSTVWGEFVLHWGPVPDPMPKAIDEAFVLDTVTRLRGEVPASFAVEMGEKMKINSHKGYSVLGTAGDQGIRTLYSVFHCNKSDRLFLSQIDLNTACGTPDSITERLSEVERTISCHGVNRRINNPKVPMKMNFPAINLSFFIPEGWRSDVYQESSTAVAGGVWTLPVESNHKVLFARDVASDAAAAAVSTLDRFRTELLKAGTSRTVELIPEADGVPTDLGGHHQLKGSVLVKDEAFSWESGEHLFRIQLWEEGGNWQGVLYTVLNRIEFDGRKVYLQPDDSTFTSLEERLTKAVDGFPAP
jgi:hypothetical protein